MTSKDVTIVNAYYDDDFLLKSVIRSIMFGIKVLKYDLGAAKRKRKKVDDSIVKLQEVALYKHLARSGVTGSTPSSSPTLAPCSDVVDEN